MISKAVRKKIMRPKIRVSRPKREQRTGMSQLMVTLVCSHVAIHAVTRPAITFVLTRDLLLSPVMIKTQLSNFIS